MALLWVTHVAGAPAGLRALCPETIHLHAAGPLLVYIYRLQCSTCVRAAPCIQKIHTRASRRRRKIWIRSPCMAPSARCPFTTAAGLRSRPPARPLGAGVKPSPRAKRNLPGAPAAHVCALRVSAWPQVWARDWKRRTPNFGAVSASFGGFRRPEACLSSPCKGRGSLEKGPEQPPDPPTPRPGAICRWPLICEGGQAAASRAPRCPRRLASHDWWGAGAERVGGA